MFAQGADDDDGRAGVRTEKNIPPQKTNSTLTRRSGRSPRSESMEGTAHSEERGCGNGDGGLGHGRSWTVMDGRTTGTQLNPAYTGRDSRDASGSRSSSPTGGTSAVNWFNNYNSNVQSADRAEFIDNDPPFHVNKSGYVDAGMPTRQRYRLGLDVAAEETGDSRMNNSMGDQSEGFRSVIDDLTIENKELKQRLRKLESLRCPQLGEDKLFEIKVHRLPPTKKRELEELLRGFVAGIGQPPSVGPSPPTSLPASDSSGLVVSDEPSSAPKSGLRDSAYASISASGRTSATVSSGLHTNPKISHPRPQQRHKGIAPFGVARHSLTISERAKMKPVVRRLEQLFTGRKASAAGHGSFVQQQLVSRSAARADKRTLGSSKQQSQGEGLRQANIIPIDTRGPACSSDSYEDGVWSPAPSYPGKAPSRKSSNPANSLETNQLKEQRPTRPLDLDPNRAQYPAENMDYLRHLGVCSPKQNPSLSLPQDDDWVYLNVLINMAQLHTINVTPEFVRKAITNLSDKLELSLDGRKIRWKGGTEGTNLTNDSGISGADRSSSDSPEGKSTGDQENIKRRKLDSGLYERKGPGGKGTAVDNHSFANALGHVKKRPKSCGGSTSSVDSELQSVPSKDDLFKYRPLFFHGGNYDEDDGYRSLENSFSTHSSQLADISSGQVSRGEGQTSSNNKSKSSQSGVPRTEEGPIIFFNGADFCTDLSGDGSVFSSNYSSPASNGLGAHPAAEKDVLGCSRPLVARTASGSSDFLHPLTDSRPIDREDGSSDKDSDRVLEENISAISRFNLSPELLAHGNEEAVQPIELEASGVGGVRPSDNFAIYISSTTTKCNSASRESLPSAPSSPSQNIVRRLLESSVFNPFSFYRTQARIFGPRVLHKLLSATRIDLDPSPLPPASYFFHASSSEYDTNSDSNYSSNRAAACGVGLNNSSRSSLNHTNTGHEPSSSLSRTNTKDSAEFSDNSSSINFLPYHPKRVHDERGRARAEESMTRKHESMGDADVDESLADSDDEEGIRSSAAMAGGIDDSDGSGYESGDDDRT